MDDDQPGIFLSYTIKDRLRVIEYYDYLVEQGQSVWMDVKAIKTGQNWDFEIKKALGRASIIIIFVSENSVGKRGYVQKELKIALDRYSEKLIDDVYIIPVLLDDDVVFPDELKGVQFTKASDENCKAEIQEAIHSQLKKLNIATIETQERTHLKWSFEKYSDQWDGLPGYRTEIFFLKLQSKEYSRINEINEYIRGRLLTEAMNARYAKFEMDFERFNYGQEREQRTNSIDAQCGEPFIQGKIFSILYSIHTYNSGAAHPNTNFLTFCFILDPVIPLDSLSELFVDPNAAFDIVQSSVRAQLLNTNSSNDQKPEFSHDENQQNSDEYQLDRGWVESGTENWDHFANFVIRQNTIEIFFPAYQVDCYASGPHSTKIDLISISSLLKPYIASALDIAHFN